MVHHYLFIFSLKVYECLQRHIKGPARPYLSYSSGLSLQVSSTLTVLNFHHSLVCSYHALSVYTSLKA